MSLIQKTPINKPAWWKHETQVGWTYHQLAPILRQRADSARLSTHLWHTSATSTVTAPTLVSCAGANRMYKLLQALHPCR